MSQSAKPDDARPSRKALLVGNSAYVDPAITPLLAPRTDIEKLGALLSDPAIGGFDVAPPQLDISADDFRLAISNLFADAKKNDLLLLYFAGHGVRDNNGRLYLAVRKTQIKRLNATALPAQFILDEMSKSASRRKVLILDCCHAGAVFEDGTLRARSAAYDAGLVRDSFLPVGTGTYILAASQSGQSAFEEIDPETNAAKSIYTGLIVDAISTGNAAPDSKDITVSDIHDYIREHRNRGGVETTPELTVFNQSDTLVLCSNPNVRKPLDQRLLDQLVSQNLTERNFAIDQLTKVLGGKDAYQAGLVQTAFDGRLNADDPQGKERDFELREKLKAALDAYQARSQQAVAPGKKEPKADVDGETDAVKNPSVDTQQRLVTNFDEQTSEKSASKAVTEKGAVMADPRPHRSWRRRLGIVMLTLALLLYFGLVATNMANQRGDYDLTFGNIVRLALFATPEARLEKLVVEPPPKISEPGRPKIAPGPVESLVLGKWRALLFTESDCGTAQQYARDIRAMTGRRVDLTRFYKNDPFNLVFDTGNDSNLAEDLARGARSSFVTNLKLYNKLIDVRAIQDTGEFPDGTCLSGDQITEIYLNYLISDLSGENRIESSNRIVDLFAKTSNDLTRLKISNALVFTILNATIPESDDRIIPATYAARTLSYLKPCFVYKLNVSFDEFASKVHTEDGKFEILLDSAKDNICKSPGN